MFKKIVFRSKMDKVEIYFSEKFDKHKFKLIDNLSGSFSALNLALLES
jgi:hypothetical protein